MAMKMYNGMKDAEGGERMRYDDSPPTVSVRKKETTAPRTEPDNSPLLSQMSTAVVASLRGTVRGFKEKDTATLAQAARNGQIVEELFFQSTQGNQENSSERRLLTLARELSELAKSAAEARQGANEEMEEILDQMSPYLESILDDLTPSPIRRFMPSSTAPPSRKKLTGLKDRAVLAITECDDPGTTLSGIRLFRMIEIVENAIPLAIQIGAALSTVK